MGSILEIRCFITVSLRCKNRKRSTYKIKIMKRIIFIYLLILYCASLFAQTDKKEYAAALSRQIDTTLFQQYQRVKPFFNEAYALYPSVPHGMLEAVSFSYTRFMHLDPPVIQEDESAIPSTYGLMGLTLDGRGFFRENLRYVAELSGYSVEDILSSPRDNVVAYAAAYAALQKELRVCSDRFEAQMPVLVALSEIPLSDDSVLAFALHSSLYAIACFVSDDHYRILTNATVEKPDLMRCFGRMLPRLQAKKVRLPVEDGSGINSGTTDYNGAVWNPAGTCNFSVGRSGHAISAVTIHYTQGTYASSIAWFQNCTYNGVGARASAHYVVRSIDGQITQMVREADKAWHVGNCNAYTVGIEHEAYGDIASYFTPEMYQSSADLVRDICGRHGILPLRMFYRDTLDDGTVLNYGTHSLGGESACVKIRGHQHFPNQSHTDPGPYWNWNYYYKLVNDDTPVTRLDTPSGTLTDSGGPEDNYGNDERRLWLIQVDGAESITLDFGEFDLEDNYDFLWIYDGPTVFSPLIGRWNTTSPGTVTSSGNALLVEFRSDCATTAAGWQATWQANIPEEAHSPETNILWDEDQWITEDLQLDFEDTSDGNILYRFYQFAGYNGNDEWTSNANCGFYYDDFERGSLRNWRVQQGEWEIVDGKLYQRGTGVATLQTNFASNQNDAYLYEFDMTLLSCAGDEGMAGIQFFRTDNNSRITAYQVVASPNERQIRLYRILRGNYTLLHTIDNITTETGISYQYRIIYDAPNRKILLFRNGRFLGECNEADALPTVPALSKMSLFTSGATACFDNLHVYRSRGSSVNATVGSESHCALQWQAEQGRATCKALSVILNDQRRFSPIAEKALKVDYTNPLLSEGVAVEGCRRRQGNSYIFALAIRWDNATDIHSDIKMYEYGYVDGEAVDEIRWIGTVRRCYASFSPMFRLSSPYYIAVRAVNGAGLYSEPVLSKPQYSTNARYKDCKFLDNYVSDNDLLGDEREYLTDDEGNKTQEWNQEHVLNSLYLWPNPSEGVVWVRIPPSSTIVRIFDANGQIVYDNRISENGLKQEKEVRLDVSSLRAGVYFVQSISADGTNQHGRFLKW